ncbi:IS1 family transposase [Marinigracilibium pacificum]|uniref:IS1 family transposase n=1 Tax=Marinigracilibium pacificum TaxID=2729599 RepID=A0A848J1M9_9BACT|nr:IS1 family transposase [Marinigracilibium pacificum]NMM48384.1 IS1 family transposase [Marinigracilibium pacificum]
MKCPRCASLKFVKDGFVNDRQRYQCKECHYHYSVRRKGKKPSYLKRLALFLHLEGLGYRPIEELIDVSNVSIMKWMNSLSPELKPLKSDRRRIQTIDKQDINNIIKRNKEGKTLLININENKSEIYYIKD